LQKVVSILLLCGIISGCSAKKYLESGNVELSDIVDNTAILKEVESNNITNSSIYIQKAEISIRSNEGKEKLIGSLKFQYPDKYLVSIRNTAGIEAFRIFITSDTILINNRLSRKLYYGSTEYLNNKYGFKVNGLPVLLGDYINEKNYAKDVTDCTGGKVYIDGVINESRIKYCIDCKKKKVISVKSDNKLKDNVLEVIYSNFVKNNDNLVPCKIEIKDLQREMTIEIDIKKLIMPWEGDIDFIPGNKFEKIRLL